MKKGYVLPSVERRVNYELARKPWKIKDLQKRIQEIMDRKRAEAGLPRAIISQSRVQAIIKTENPNTQTLALLAEALGLDVKLFFENEL